MLATAWSVILKRARSQMPILLAAAISIVLATTLLAAGPIYADAVYVAGAQRTLRDAPATEANIEISASIRAEQFAATDARISGALGQAVAEVGGTIVRSATSESHALPGQGEVSDLAVFAFAEGIEPHASLVSGTWSRAVDGPIEVTLPTTAASQLGIETGDRLTLTNRLDDSLVEVVIVGIFELDRTDDPYWYGDQLAIEGVLAGSSFTTHGPFVIARETFLQRMTARPVSIRWRAFPDFSGLTIEGLPGLRNRVEGLESQINDQTTVQADVATGLPALASSIERSLLATRSSVLILTIQLALLAGYTLILTAGLLVGQRRQETLLLRSRGAGTRQIVILTVLEGSLLVIPAVVAGPWLAALSLHGLNWAGPLAAAGLTLEPVVTRPAIALSALAGLICLAALLLPAMRSARAGLQTGSRGERQGARSRWQRGQLDIAILALAGIGFLQLRRYGSPLTETVQGRLEVDPLLVAAPALGLLAGAILALRLVPWLTRGLDIVARHDRRLPLALGAWQFARRPQRYSRAALLLMLAVGVGLFAVAYTRTWETSQDDQAGFQVGADLRVLPDQRPDAIPPLRLDSAYQQVDGLGTVMPIDASSVRVTDEIGSADLILLDSDLAAEVVAFRADLAQESFPTLMRRLIAARPLVAGLPLPGEPHRLALDISSTIQRPCGDDSANANAGGDCIEIDAGDPRIETTFRSALTASVILRDSSGGIYRLRLEPLNTDGQSHRYVLPLTATRDDGRLLTPQYPLELVGFDIDTLAPSGIARSGAITLHHLLVSDATSGEDWSMLARRPTSWAAGGSRLTATSGISPIAATEPGNADAIVTARFDTGLSALPSPLPVTLRLRPDGSETPPTIPVIISEHLMEAAALRIGDRFVVDVAGGERNLTVTGTVRAFPSLTPEQPLLIIADLETLLAAQLAEPGRALLTTEARWLVADPDVVAATVEVLQSPAFSSRAVETRWSRSQSLRTDPVTLGTIGALLIGVLAAVVFAIVGFIVSATVSAHERLREFALLRAIGLSGRQLAGWLLVENGALVLISLIGGTLLGLLLSWLVLPLIAVSQQATGVFPRVIVVIPWRAISLLQASLLTTLAVSSVVLVFALRGRGLGAALRIGEN